MIDLYANFPTYKPEANLFIKNNNPELYTINYQKKKTEKKCIIDLAMNFCGPLLIIGGGLSWLTLNYDDIKIDKMVINYNFTVPAKWSIYHDRRVYLDITPVEFRDNRFILGPMEYSEYANYYYTEVSPKFRHTGAYALYYAVMLGYSPIYLIGYDYYPVNGVWHSYEVDNFYKDEKVNVFLNDFKNISGEIYNLNKDSKLTKYEFKEGIT